jgi:hypothetical protein
MMAVFLFVALAHGASFVHPSGVFTFDYDESTWKPATVKSGARKMEDIDRRLSETVLASFQRTEAHEKYHARFSVVTEDISTFTLSSPDGLDRYRRRALEFLKSQRFQIVSKSETMIGTEKLPAWEIIANQRDFGLTFRQAIIVRGSDAFLLTAATRIIKYAEQKKEIDRFFDSFRFIPSIPQIQSQEKK